MRAEFYQNEMKLRKLNVLRFHAAADECANNSTAPRAQSFAISYVSNFRSSMHSQLMTINNSLYF